MSKYDKISIEDAYNLIYDKKIKDNASDYKKVLDKAIEEPVNAYTLIDYGIIDQKSKYYKKILDKAIENIDFAYYLLEKSANDDYYLTEETDYYKQVLDKILEDEKLAFLLIKNKIITSKSPYYKEVLSKAAEDDENTDELEKDALNKVIFNNRCAWMLGDKIIKTSSIYKTAIRHYSR